MHDWAVEKAESNFDSDIVVVFGTKVEMQLKPRLTFRHVICNFEGEKKTRLTHRASATPAMIGW